MAAHTTGHYGGTAFPFAAIAGMDDLKLALLLNAVSPAIGGVLVRGEKGTAKSTLVRGLAELLPPVDVVEGCRFSCDPGAPDPGCPDGPHSDGAGRSSRPARLAELPVGATEDRLAGSLDIERALTAGVAAFEPGLLAAAHRGILYVDEVNLLHDHLVDLLLDAAALGVNYVEREGVSVRHAARFLLVGTMNPEEGELRPQLLDRFGLTVEAAASRDPAQRAEVVRRRLAYEADPAGFAGRWAAETGRLAAQVAAARERLGSVRLPDAALDQICAVCASFEVDGLRADLVTARTAIALAAWHGRAEVGPDDIRQAARLALPHRRRRDPFDAPGLDDKALDEALEEALSSPPDGPDDDGGPPPPPPPPPPGGSPPPGPGQDGQQASSAAVPPATPPPADPSAPAPAAQTVPPSEAYRTRLLAVGGIGQGAPGRRSAARTPLGRQAGARRPVGRVHSVHLPATLRAAAHRLAGEASGGKYATRSAGAGQGPSATQGPEAVRGFPAAPGEAATASGNGVAGEAGAARREKAMPTTAPGGTAPAGGAGAAGDAVRASRALSSPGPAGTSQGGTSGQAGRDGLASRGVSGPGTGEASQRGRNQEAGRDGLAGRGASGPGTGEASQGGRNRKAALDGLAGHLVNNPGPGETSQGGTSGQAGRDGLAGRGVSGLGTGEASQGGRNQQAGRDGLAGRVVSKPATGGTSQGGRNQEAGLDGLASRVVSKPATGGTSQGGRNQEAGRDGLAGRGANSPGTGETGKRGRNREARRDGPAGRGGPARPLLRAADLRESVRIGREGNLVLFAVDASGSMAAGQRMRAVKGAVGSLLRDAYQRRDKVGLITFRGTEATLALPPTSSVEAGARRLAVLPTGGRTPLAAGLALAARVLAAERLRDPDRRPLLVVVTDGRATSGSAADLDRAAARLAGIPAIVVDCETGMVRLGLAGKLAVRLGAVPVRLDELAAGRLAGVVRAAAPRGRRAA